MVLQKQRIVGVLNINVIEARKLVLPPNEDMKKLELFVSMRTDGSGYKMSGTADAHDSGGTDGFRTATVKAPNAQPVWNSVHKCLLTGEERTCFFSLYHDGVLNNYLLGIVAMRVDQVVQLTQPQWLPIMRGLSKEDKVAEMGELQLAVEFVPALTVKAHSARNIAVSSCIGQPNTYLKIRYDMVKLKTGIVSGKDPDFDKRFFYMNIDDPKKFPKAPKTLLLELWQKNRFLWNTRQGIAEVAVEKLLASDGKDPVFYKLLRKRGGDPTAVVAEVSLSVKRLRLEDMVEDTGERRVRMSTSRRPQDEEKVRGSQTGGGAGRHSTQRGSRTGGKHRDDDEQRVLSADQVKAHIEGKPPMDRQNSKPAMDRQNSRSQRDRPSRLEDVSSSSSDSDAGEASAGEESVRKKKRKDRDGGEPKKKKKKRDRGNETEEERRERKKRKKEKRRRERANSSADKEKENEQAAPVRQTTRRKDGGGDISRSEQPPARTSSRRRDNNELELPPVRTESSSRRKEMSQSGAGAGDGTPKRSSPRDSSRRRSGDPDHPSISLQPTSYSRVKTKVNPNADGFSQPPRTKTSLKDSH